MLAALSPRPIVKPLSTLLLLTTVAAAHYVNSYGVVLDTAMLQNVLHTDYFEARELVGSGLVWNLLKSAFLPVAVIWSLPLARLKPTRAVAHRLLAIVGGAVIGWSPMRIRRTVSSNDEYA